MSMPSNQPKVLAALPGTVRQLSKRTGLSECQVRRYLRALHASGAAHIGKRYRTGGLSKPKWVAGPGQHAAMPAPRTNADYVRKYRRRARLALVASRAKRATQVPVFRDSLVAAFWGPA